MFKIAPQCFPNTVILEKTDDGPVLENFAWNGRPLLYSHHDVAYGPSLVHPGKVESFSPERTDNLLKLSDHGPDFGYSLLANPGGSPSTVDFDLASVLRGVLSQQISIKREYADDIARHRVTAGWGLVTQLAMILCIAKLVLIRSRLTQNRGTAKGPACYLTSATAAAMNRKRFPGRREDVRSAATER